jgi:hypothetical protein
MLLLVTGSMMAQQPLEHPNKIYKSPEGKLYVNRNAPIYLRIATDSVSDRRTHLLRSEETSQYANPMYFDTEGINTIRSPWKVDPETRSYVYPKEDVVFVVYADSKPPSSRVDFGTEEIVTEGGTVYAGEPLTLRFNTSDALSGVEKVYYSLDGTPYQVLKQPLKINQEKSFVLRYYAVDHVGNAEKPRQVSVVTDLSKPRSAHQIKGDQYENVISGRSEIHIQAEDEVTGVRQTWFSIDGSEARPYRAPIKGKDLSEGEHMLTYYSVDKVNNTEEMQKFSFYVDKTPPRVMEELIGNSFTVSDKEYFSGRNKLKFISMDNKAGVKEIRYSVNGGEFKVYEEPFNLSQSGNLQIQTLAIDRVNNKKKTRKLTNRPNASYVDLTGPELSHRFEGPVFPYRDTFFISNRTRIILQGEDSESGLKNIDYKQQNQARYTTYTDPFTLEEEGAHMVHYTGYDNLENSSSAKIECIVDSKGPAIHHRFSMPSGGTKHIEGSQIPILPAHAMLFLSATDSSVGLEQVSYTVNGDHQQNYQGAIQGFNPGTLYRIHVTASDKLGNTRKQEIRFYVEK